MPFIGGADSAAIPFTLQFLMERYIQSPEVRWADLDPNFHLRHSVYYDYGAYCRICFLNEYGITSSFLLEHHIGPILFREECVFRREIRSGDKISIDLALLKAKEDISRWSIRHNIYKNESELAAVITIDGAWIDTIKRKLAVPPELISKGFHIMPKTTDFEWLK